MPERVVSSSNIVEQLARLCSRVQDGHVPPTQLGFLPELVRQARARSHADRQILYALTRICLLQYIKGMESVFEIIAEPNRREILSLLASSPHSVGEIERHLGVPQPTVSKHLRVLREAGFVESTVDAQRRLYGLRPEPLQEIDAWLAQFRRFWSAHVDALERHLDRMERMNQSTATKTQTMTKKKTRRKPADKGEMK